MSYQKNCDRSDAGSARRAKKWREHLYRRSAFRLRTKDCIQTILFVKYLHKLRRIFIEGMGGASYKVYPANTSLQLSARRHLKDGK